MNHPDITSHADWLQARQELLVKEKALTRELDAMAAQRRRLPMFEVEEPYAFEAPEGEVSLLDLFDGRRQLLLYRFFSTRAWRATRRMAASAAR